MYTDVHMLNVMPITDFRKKIFDAADWIVETKNSIDIQRDGKVILRVMPVDQNDAQERARRLLALAPTISGIWKNIPETEFEEIDEMLRGKTEKIYQKKLKNRKW